MQLEDLVQLFLFGFAFQPFDQLKDKLLNLFAVVLINLLQCTWLLDHGQKVNDLLLFVT